MERIMLPGSLDELKAAHPEVTTCIVDGVHRATVHLDDGLGELHAGSEGELLVRLMAALGG